MHASKVPDPRVPIFQVCKPQKHGASKSSIDKQILTLCWHDLEHLRLFPVPMALCMSRLGAARVGGCLRCWDFPAFWILCMRRTYGYL